MDNKDFKYLKVADFEPVGLVSNTCNKQKLNISTNEALNFDLIHTFCFEFIKDLLDNWGLAELTDELAALKPYNDQIKRLAIIGGTYRDDAGHLENFAGIRTIWAYYSYSKYVIINSSDDTPNGLASKTNNYSIPVDMARLKAIETKFKNMGKDATDHTLLFLYQAREFLPSYDYCSCKLSCGCVGRCSCKGKPKKLGGFKIKNVEK